MSKENVEIVRRVWEALERRDTEALFALYDPAIVWDQRAGPTELVGLYHCHEGVRQVFREWLESFDTYHAHADTYIDAGNDVVVVGYRVSGRGKASGAEVDMPRWNVYRIRKALVIRVEVFETKAEALEAAGLSEDAHTSS
jgi:uncharacterized protein